MLSKNLITAKPLNKCELCKTRGADGLLGKLCQVCVRRISYEKLPPEQKRVALLEMVPERYLDAEMRSLPVELQTKFLLEIDTGVLLWGAAGVGKTYGMAVLAKKYLKEGYSLKRVHYEMLCLRLRDTFNPKATHTEWGIIEPLLNCDKLFIEDVGTSKSIGKQESDFSLRTFLVLLDMRMERCRPTFVTSNKSVENLSNSFDERVGDRLRTFYVYKLTGDSKRKAP